MKQYLGVFLKGFCMGCADIVPGVSGGTIALISGIYQRLLKALSSFDLVALRLLFQGRFKSLLDHVDAAFIASLLSGILLAVVTMANILSYLLANYSPVVWGFFSGLVLASTVFLVRGHSQWRLSFWLPFCCGMVLPIALALTQPGHIEPTLLIVFLSAVLAICAMVLPGISGSFILLMLGMYEHVLRAVGELDLLFLIVFMAGCAVGILSFSRLISFLLEKYTMPVMAVLTGILAGSILKLWPWQFDGRFLLPADYSLAHSTPNFLFVTAIAWIMGMVVILLSQRLLERNEKNIE
ncbi:DUF368 domain-containing protein [Gynuella sunshinyii]|uniref:Putative membrane protein n=1 Tax=Gynuella sunshinyii YC6258 TaxID=1445510 RepID=A0A0C5W1B8_9GAMM|nr:DUF368 domain-containing protein [Gynuella sunshinyii]AJQ96479.1 putative membrane protein [Gynuella sunshinyii YC6258]